MAALTTIERSVATNSLRAMALALFPMMQWRHHGIGVLQGYVAEDSKPEVRLHIWHPALLKPGMDTSGDIHDHRFDMVSHVLHGHVAHEEIFPEEAAETETSGRWAMLALTHARAAKDTGYHGPTKELPGRFNVRRVPMYIQEGYTYRFPALHFHRSPVVADTFAITCVEKHAQRDTAARILYPVNHPPVMAFGHDMDWAVVGPVLEKAKEALTRLSGERGVGERITQ